MAKTVYAWRPGTSVKGVTAQTAGEELAKIDKRDGGVTPPAVVEAAKPEDAKLHPAFTWDDARAAELHRLNEARNLIRCVCVVEKPKGEEAPKKVVQFVHVPQPKAPVYVQTKRALTAEETRRLVVQEALRHMAGLEFRYGQLTELAPIFDAIRAVRQQQDGTQAEAA